MNSQTDHVTGQCENITAIPTEMPWLSVLHRDDFKLTILMFTALPLPVLSAGVWCQWSDTSASFTPQTCCQLCMQHCSSKKVNEM